MSKRKLDVRAAVMAAFIAGFGVSNVAFAVYEIEPNDPLITTAQPLVIGSGGNVEVTGEIGNGPSGQNDVDFFSFHGVEGDVVTIDINNGIKPDFGPGSVDTYIAIFGPGPQFKLLFENDNESDEFNWDARITGFRLPQTGTYTVGVSSNPRFFADGGILLSTELHLLSHGSYSMLISGVTPSGTNPSPTPTPPPSPSPEVQSINIEIKPGTGQRAPINPKSKGSIPVALLSNAQFNALEVDRESLTFGASGDESSRLRCNKDGLDVNQDGRADLLCHFDNQAAGFQPGDLHGIVKGKKADGSAFEGRGWLKAMPVPRRKQ